MPELQLPCPPLTSWLPDEVSTRRPGLLELVASPRRLRPLLAELSQLESVPMMKAPSEHEPQGTRFDAVLIVADLKTAPGPSAELARWLEPGARVVELIEVRRSWPAAMLGLERPQLRRAERAARRIMDWSMAGVCELEQWASPDPADLVVTLGRWVGDVEPGQSLTPG